ncbi:hypothetical protein [Polaromonas sp. OV174]|uniref:hypothetical protein n=1 Tax=Polaromonas sp. OV174 TaxID=1855300 RepID=UPI001160A026|nr:hypothetical protein [Polaromonas sp. OV174]
MTVDTRADGKGGFFAIEIAFSIVITSDAAHLASELMSALQMEMIRAGGFINQLRQQSGMEFFDV